MERAGELVTYGRDVTVEEVRRAGLKGQIGG